MKYLPFLLFFIIALSCNNNDDKDIACTEIFVFGLNVTVRDSSNNELLKEGISVVAKDGSYIEELIVTEDSDYFFGAGERQGNYSITVIGEGYETFTSETITVSGDVCHVETEFLEIYLVPN